MVSNEEDSVKGHCHGEEMFKLFQQDACFVFGNPILLRGIGT